MKEKKKSYLFFVTMILLVFGFSILCDIFLGLLGFPSEQYAHRPNYTQVRKTIEFENEFSTNSQGFRYREIPPRKQSANERRILVVGDSFTEGWGVEQSETFSAVLESLYGSTENKVYFINAGLSGRGPLQYLYSVFQVGIKYDIDGVLICLYANDLQDTPEAADFTPSLNYKSNRSGLYYFIHFLYPRIYMLVKNAKRKNQMECDIIAETLKRAKQKGLSVQLIASRAAKISPELVDAANRKQFNGGILTTSLLRPNYWTAGLDIETKETKRKWRNMDSILSYLVNECRGRGIVVGAIFLPCAFLVNPDSHQATNPWVQSGAEIKERWLTGPTKLQKNLLAWSKKMHVPYLDLTPEFRNAERTYEDDIHYPLDCHWTPLGHQIAAQAIAKWLNVNLDFVFERSLSMISQKE